MKKKIIFGIFALILMTISLTQSFQNKYNGFSFEQLSIIPFAQGEEVVCYTIEWGDDIGSQHTTYYDCYRCQQYEGFQLTYQPQEVICEDPGDEVCPDSGGRVLVSRCWKCGYTG